jgi:hypothetical protein
VLLSYDMAARLALEALKKNPPRVGSHSLRIETLQILPSGQDVVIGVKFCIDQNWDPTDALSGCGTGYLRGTPEYDANARTIRVVNLHYDLQTEDLMLRAMHALAGPELSREMEKGFKYDIGKEIDRMQRDISAAIAKPQGRDVVISGNVQSYGPVTLTWTAEGFLATFSAQGSIHAEVRI